jgi:hypothetical protein
LGWATFWAIFLQTHLVTLIRSYVNFLEREVGSTLRLGRKVEEKINEQRKIPALLPRISIGWGQKRSLFWGDFDHSSAKKLASF